jgi:hypothetical protein
MNLGWKQLLPAAVANFIVVGIWLVATRLYGSAGGWIAAIVSYALTYLFFLKFVFKSKTGKPTFETRTVTMVNSPAKKEAS